MNGCFSAWNDIALSPVGAASKRTPYGSRADPLHREIASLTRSGGIEHGRVEESTTSAAGGNVVKNMSKAAPPAPSMAILLSAADA
jgi:hypothetical protein